MKIHRHTNRQTDKQTLSTTRNSWDQLAHSSLCKMLRDWGFKGYKGLNVFKGFKGLKGIWRDLKKS